MKTGIKVSPIKPVSPVTTGVEKTSYEIQFNELMGILEELEAGTRKITPETDLSLLTTECEQKAQGCESLLKERCPNYWERFYTALSLITNAIAVSEEPTSESALIEACQTLWEWLLDRLNSGWLSAISITRSCLILLEKEVAIATEPENSSLIDGLT